MSGVNKVILVGNLGKDPEVRYLEGNVAVAKFSLATSESYKNREGQRVDQTEWHNVVLWRGLAEVAEKYLHKGSKIYLEGKIRSRSYDDKDGIKRYATDIVGDAFTMLDRKHEDGSTLSAGPGANGNNHSRMEETPLPAASSEPGDDLPF